jgi:hypothetical protein
MMANFLKITFLKFDIYNEMNGLTFTKLFVTNGSTTRFTS